MIGLESLCTYSGRIQEYGYAPWPLNTLVKSLSLLGRISFARSYINKQSKAFLMLSMGGSILTDEDRKLLLRVNQLLEEVLETLEVMSDKETVEAIREAEEDVKAGRVRGYDEFVEELRRSGEI